MILSADVKGQKFELDDLRMHKKLFTRFVLKVLGSLWLDPP